jgi:putative glycosyltransferase (TIGR04348 family)
VGGLPDVRHLTVVIATPASRGSHKGNRVTAVRWAGHLRALGHHVTLAETWDGRPCDVLVALHATRSHPTVLRYREQRPAAPLVVGLAGTDLYQDLPASAEARRSLELATRVTVLQPLGLQRLAPEVRAKARVILQSARRAPAAPPPAGVLQACLLAHLRAVKGPFLAAEAVRRLRPGSRWRVVHLGAALDADAAERARGEMALSPRYDWRGDLPRHQALGVLAGSAILLVTSLLEGGSNAVSEAIAAGIPVLSTRVDGSMGVLGSDYPGLFPVGDAGALAALLARVEDDPAFLQALRARVEALRPLVEPAREREAWRALLAELAPP